MMNMQIRKLLFSVISSILIMGSAHAQSRGFGVGAILGDPTGITAKYWLNKKSALSTGLGWSSGKTSKVHWYGDYLIHNYRLFRLKKGKLPVYYGIGLRMKSDDEIKGGVRVPLGIAYQFENYPLDVLAEIAPILELFPSTKFTASGGIGLRYFFK
ncbi:MAG: hypothetical protein ACI86H_001550 [bacterium]|jgi:hypothetical protein